MNREDIETKIITVGNEYSKALWTAMELQAERDKLATQLAKLEVELCSANSNMSFLRGQEIGMIRALEKLGE